MSDVSSMLISSILSDLGHEVPDQDELEKLLQKASDKIKLSKGLEPEEVEYKFVAVEKEWMRDTLKNSS